MLTCKEYRHLTCDICGGIIGSYDRGVRCKCDRCGKEYEFHELNYEYLEINDKTGWIFPMVRRDYYEKLQLQSR